MPLLVPADLTRKSMPRSVPRSVLPSAIGATRLAGTSLTSLARRAHMPSTLICRMSGSASRISFTGRHEACAGARAVGKKCRCRMKRKTSSNTVIRALTFSDRNLKKCTWPCVYFRVFPRTLLVWVLELVLVDDSRLNRGAPHSHHQIFPSVTIPCGDFRRQGQRRRVTSTWHCSFAGHGGRHLPGTSAWL